MRNPNISNLNETDPEFRETLMEIIKNDTHRENSLEKSLRNKDNSMEKTLEEISEGINQKLSTIESGKNEEIKM